MLKSSFHYDLPPELIARHPSAERSASRLLVVPESGEFVHTGFSECLDYLKPADLLVFNNTKVVPARLYGRKASGGAIEILVERVLEDNRVLAQVRSSKSPKPESQLILDDETLVQVVRREESFFLLEAGKSWIGLMDRLGHIPLPPYIDREDEPEDLERYQTVYAKNLGAVAAPTAGLHFDRELIDRIQKAGVNTAEITLHVGSGTFQPIRADDVRDHKMHSEWIEISAEVCDQIKRTKACGGRVITVGTTAMRTLESAADSDSGIVQPFAGETDIFIRPGYQFRVVDALITNFHLPESTLLMLVSAFSGYQRIKAAYDAAIKMRYRFFSYGDAMFLERNQVAHKDLPQ